MFSLFVQLGMNFKQIKHELPVIHVETFNSMKKRAGVVFRVRFFFVFFFLCILLHSCASDFMKASVLIFQMV